MATSKLLKSLFQYKAWANEDLFIALKALNETAHQAELHSAIRILNHIYVVDRIFVANLQGKPHEYTATNTSETPSLDELHQAAQKTDRWYLEYVSAVNPQEL